MTKTFRIVVACLCAILLVSSVALLVALTNFENSRQYVKLDTAKLTQVYSDLKILDNDGNEISQALYWDNLKQIPISALPDFTPKAFVAVEDKRFFQHKGIDLRRIAGAAIHNLKSKRFKEGASTITQQLIKNTHLDNKKNVKRKINEMQLALQLEKMFSKEKILEMYLNTIYFGRNAYGIESAANVYFNKSACQLSLAESATLAALIKAPNNYAPDKNLQKCLQRRNIVLKLMLDQDLISAEQHQKATQEELTFLPYCTAKHKDYVQMAIEQACQLLKVSQRQLLRSGLTIKTYFDKKIQSALELAISQEDTRNKDGTTADLACIVCTNDGNIAACHFRGESALQSKQIGSAAKPIAVYAPALCEKLISQASPVLDEPCDFNGYKPQNASGYHGWTTVKFAIAKSLNVPAVRTLNTLGLNKANKYLQLMGLQKQQNLSAALGNLQGGVTPQQLANCYATLANGGICSGVSFIESIWEGKDVLFQRKLQNTQVFDQNSTFLMTDMLKYAVKNGTAKALEEANMPIAAKTGTVGTADGNTQALVAGYTTQHTFVVWYSGNLANSINGATAPCQLAAKILKNMYTTPPQDFEPPKGVCKLTLNKDDLYNRQQMCLDKWGESFYFDNANRPKVPETLQTNCNYKIELAKERDKWVLQLPEVEGCNWEIFRVNKGAETLCDTNLAENGIFFARLKKNGVTIYTTLTIRVSLP